MVVVKRSLTRLPHCFQCCKVDDIVNIWVCREDLVKLFLVGDVALDVFGSLAANQLNAVEDFIGGVVEIVDDDDFVICFEKRESGEGTDVARAAALACGISIAWSKCKVSLHCQNGKDVLPGN